MATIDDPQRTPEVGRRETILIVTDSLGFPRPEPELLRYEDTYIARLRREFPEYDIVHYGQGGATIGRLFGNMSYFRGTLSPRYCFIQSGIVDCAPRAMTEVELQIVKRIPILGAAIGKLIQKNAKAIRRARKLQYTPLAQYAAFVDRFDALFPAVWWIGIAPAGADYESYLLGIDKQIKIYNEVLEKRNYIKCGDFDESDIMSDHHHLNSNGHRKIFERISSIIRQNDSIRYKINK